MNSKLSVAEWATTTEACKRLKINRTLLYRLRVDEGILEEGKHYRRNGITAHAPLVWDLVAVEQSLRAYRPAAAGKHLSVEAK